ncbi:MAG: hypothetical protein HY724_09895 [Candidatus Rokubacteria bacterium]|nr:hypothetical protein [Candidatus Rokubacteria bacterium]
MRWSRACTGVLVGLLVLPAAAWARSAGSGRTAQPARRQVVDNSQYIDVNRILMWVTNTGSFAWDKTSGNAGLEFPKGTAKTAVFAAGLWIGGKVGGLTGIAVAEYSDEYGPGAMVGGVADDPTRPQYKVYKLNRTYATDAERDAALADYEAGAEPYGAPDVAVQADGSLNVLGDQMLWAVYNDADPVNHTNRAGSTASLGVEVQQTTFAFNRLGALGQTIFVKYRIINKGGNTIDSMYVSQWSDPDLGGFTDDLVGGDVGLSLGFCYNATNNDGQYGSAPPAVGYDFFQGPKLGGVPLGMTSFNKYINGTDPDDFQKTYNYMKGLNPDGTPLVNPVTGQVTTYFVSGDPVTASGWLDTNPADRRLMLSSGPFSMAPGDTQEVVTAILIGDASNRLSSIALLRFYDAIAQTAFDQSFQLANPPNAPVVTVTPREGKVYLSWDTSSETYSQAPYEWEGYVVYQGASIAGPWKRVATFDRNNGITVVLDPDFDEESGVVLPQVKAQGSDVGVSYQVELTQDAIRGGPLRVGTPYYFSVNGYSVGIGQVPQVLESAFNPIAVVPQTPAGGVDWSTAAITSGPTYGQVNPGLAPTTDSIQVRIVDPDKVIDANYRVGYKPGPTGAPVWYVVRTTATSTDTVPQLNNLFNYSGDENYPVFDGLQVKLFGAPYKELLTADYVNLGPNPPALAGVDVDLAFFNDAADYAFNLFGSALDPANVTLFNSVEIRFSSSPTLDATWQKGYRYMRSAASPRTYLLQDYVDVPWTVWDIENNRQLNAGWLENEVTADGVWNPDTTEATLGNRELIWPMASTYSPTADPFYTDPARDDALNESDQIDFQYVLWPWRTVTGGLPTPFDAGDKFVFILSNRSANDFYTFSTAAPNRMNATLAKNELARVRAVPNPYFAHSRYELNQFSKMVKFTHLPARCTIRLFTLAGDLVRTIEKNDPGTSQAVWDLETERGLPVGSGIYIFHVDAPGVGTVTGKVAIFMEKERLTNF